MTRRDARTALQQMRDHAAEAMQLAQDRRREDLDEDRLLSLALVRLVEIVGEAARRVPSADRGRHRSIPWVEIIGMRDRLIHGYDQVDFDVLWQVVTADLPGLVRDLERALAGG